LATGEPTEHLVETIRLQPVSMLIAAGHTGSRSRPRPAPTVETPGRD
jgi:hypothetical protein